MLSPCPPVTPCDQGWGSVSGDRTWLQFVCVARLFHIRADVPPYVVDLGCGPDVRVSVVLLSRSG